MARLSIWENRFRVVASSFNSLFILTDAHTKSNRAANIASDTASAFLRGLRDQRLFLDFNASAPLSGLEERRWPNETRQRRRHEGGPSRHARRLGRRRRSPAPRPHRALRRSSCARRQSDHSRRAPGRPGRAAAGAQPLPLRIPDPPRAARSTHSRLLFFLCVFFFSCNFLVVII